MNKAFRKNLLRVIKKSMGRFLSILVIVAIGVAFFAGVRATSPDMLLTGDKYLHENKIADLILLSSKGFTEKDVNSIKALEGVEEVIKGYNFDAFAVSSVGEKPVKVHSFNIQGQRVNKPVLLKGTLPSNEEECITENSYMKSENLSIGDYIELKTTNNIKKFKIVGTVNSPLYLSNYDRGNNSLGNGKTTAFFQIGEKASEELAIPVIPAVARSNGTQMFTEISVLVKGTMDQSYFSDKYKSVVDPVKERITALGKSGNAQGWYVLNINNNEGISGFKNNAERIGAIGKVFPLFFFLIATLVCLTSMTRMVEEKRTEIGTLKALGYGKLTIISEYFLYSFLASIGGCVLGTLIGFKLFPTTIFNAYKIMYSLPTVISPFHMDLAVTSTLVAVLCTTVAAVLACISELISVPAVLMRPKAPMAGKRIVLEKISFLWKRMTFIEKVTARNILRYKKRFFMTIIGIAGCTALLLTGYGLKDSILSITDKQFNDIYSYNMTSYLRSPIAQDGLSEIKSQIKGVTDINSSIFLYQQTVSVDKNGSKKSLGSVYLMVPEDKASLNNFIHLKSKKENFQLSDEGVIITEKVANTYKVSPGDTIDITLGEKVIQVKVTDISEQYVGHYVYMSTKYYEEMLKESTKFNSFLSIIKNTSKTEEDALSTELMKDKRINSVNFTTSISENFKKSMKGMDSVIWVLIISAAALAFVVMFNLTTININERIRELATIKVLGFYDYEVAEYIFRESMVLSLLGTLVGLILGIGLHRYVVVTSEIEAIMFVRTIKPLSFLYASVLTLIFSAVVNLVMYRSIKRINMVESLKSAE